MNNILLIEDAKEIYPLVKNALISVGNVVWVNNLEAAKKKIQDESFDLVLLDLGLPDGSGLDLLAEMRESNLGTPIFLLTSATDTSEKVLCFSAGADDYITKPFDPLELMARVSAKLKKENQKFNQSNILRWSNLELIKSKQIVRDIENPGKPVELSSIEFKLFFLLAMKQGEIVSRDEILNEVWGDDVFVSPRSVDIYISKLRKKFEHHPKLIKSVHGVGYQLQKT